MTKILIFALIGLGPGAIYGLVASGVVVIHRGSGVINFAHGAVGMVGTFIYWKVTTSLGLPIAIGVIVGVAASGILGLGIHLIIMRPMKTSALLTRIVATLAVLILLQSVAYLIFGQSAVVVTSFLPSRGVRLLGGTIVENRFWLLGIGAAITICLWAFYRFTGFGRSTTAVAENGLIAATSGISADSVAAGNWALGSALAAIAGILITPIAGLQVTSLTLLVVPALAAALGGNLISFPLTFACGVAIGVLQSVVGAYVTLTGVSSALPAVAVVIAVVARGHSLPLRSFVFNRLPSVGSGAVSPVRVAAVLLAALLAIQYVFSATWLGAITASLAGSIILLSYVVLTGYAGQISLTQFALAGVGALVAGHLAENLHTSFLIALIVGAVATLPVSVLIGLPALRSRGMTLAIVTLAAAYVAETVVFANGPLTGQEVGLEVGSAHIFGLDVDPLNHPGRYATVVVIVFGLMAWCVANLRRSRVGQRLLAVRDNERAAASLGISVAATKLYAFALGGVIAGVGGVLLAFSFPIVTFANYTTDASINMLSYAVVGGVGFVAGPLLGGTFVGGGVGEQILAFTGQNAEVYLPLIGSLVTLWILVRHPDGLAPVNIEAARAIGRRLTRYRMMRRGNEARSAPGSRMARPSAGRSGWLTRVTRDRTVARGLSPDAFDTMTPVHVQAQTLRLTEVTVDFGGVRAVDRVSFEVCPGEIVGLIGPNGAGKTTVIDAITGFVRPSHGRVELGEQEIGGLTVRERALAGIGRLFQSLELFEDLSVLDNLRVAAAGRSVERRAYVTELVRPRTAAPTAAMVEAIRDFGITSDLDRTPGQLSYARRRLAAIARSVAMEPSVLLLDEPAAGLSDVDAHELEELVRRLADGWGMGILLVEHNVDFVMSVCDRVVVLDFGRRLAEGRPHEVRENPDVIGAYLG
jgi:sulfate-transporting ATPase